VERRKKRQRINDFMFQTIARFFILSSDRVKMTIPGIGPLLGGSGYADLNQLTGISNKFVGI
jgi:hypothetical protein